jgi:hypothetical protein
MKHKVRGQAGQTCFVLLALRSSRREEIRPPWLAAFRFTSSAQRYRSCCPHSWVRQVMVWPLIEIASCHHSRLGFGPRKLSGCAHRSHS